MSEARREAAAGRSSPARPASAKPPRPLVFWIVLTLSATLLFTGFVALGTWQVHRRIWKLDLIERVDQRVHAPAVAAPALPEWPALTAAADEYRHVQARGQWLAEGQVLTQASTELGAGFWVLTPLRLDAGGVVLINRGFIDGEAARQAPPRPVGPAQVSGLLRWTEPGGGFLRHNDPAANRWYSRDTQAIAASLRLGATAPYFIDAEAVPGAPADAPVGGLTVIAFHNSHLVYAITWYTLALMVAGGTALVVREERRRRRLGAAARDDGGARG